jgi:hypothetical protein
MIKNLVLVISISILSACSNQIDKCVDSQIAARQAEIIRHKQEEQAGTKSIWEIIEMQDKRTLEELKAEYRLKCMRAMSK